MFSLPMSGHGDELTRLTLLSLDASTAFANGLPHNSGRTMIAQNQAE
jgi:hypothetical protein